MPESQLKAHKTILTTSKLLKEQTIKEQVNGLILSKDVKIKRKSFTRTRRWHESKHLILRLQKVDANLTELGAKMVKNYSFALWPMEVRVD